MRSFVCDIDHLGNKLLHEVHSLWILPDHVGMSSSNVDEPKMGFRQQNLQETETKANKSMKWPQGRTDHTKQQN